MKAIVIVIMNRKKLIIFYVSLLLIGLAGGTYLARSSINLSRLFGSSEGKNVKVYTNLDSNTTEKRHDTPRNELANKEEARLPYWDYYNEGVLEKHDPSEADDLGLVWNLPLLEKDLGNLRISKLGGAYCPTMTGRERGPWGHRYYGIHRGHDLGVPIKNLGARKIPVHVIADGVYDGQRTYTHARPLPKDCRPLVVYHFPQKRKIDKVYTSIYCHVDPLPDLKVGKQLKVGDIIGTLEDPEGSWDAHVHLEIYTRPVYTSKDTTKLSRCGCSSDKECDNLTRQRREIPRGCGIFEDDRYIMEPVLFLKKHGG